VISLTDASGNELRRFVSTIVAWPSFNALGIPSGWSQLGFQRCQTENVIINRLRKLRRFCTPRLALYQAMITPLRSMASHCLALAALKLAWPDRPAPVVTAT